MSTPVYYALSFKNSDGTTEQGVYRYWNQCQYLMNGKSNIHVKKFKTQELAEQFLNGLELNAPHSIRTTSKETFQSSNGLTEEQQSILQYLMDHPTKSCFITGPAGTGKSFVVKEIIRWMRYEGISYGITGSTGASAVLIGGKTLHSFLGLGLGRKSVSEYVKYMKPIQKRRLQKLDTLLIDEISMISDTLLDKINELLKVIRNSELPFGGIRLIFIGDACQLPPVEGTYFFKSNAWMEANPQVFFLTRLLRQDKDVPFQEMLMRLRWGKCNEHDYQALKACKQRKWPSSMIVQPTRLYATNMDVDAENDKAFADLMEQSEEGLHLQSYPIQYLGVTKPTQLESLKRWASSCRIPESITLCKGVQVMVTWNIQVEAGIVNGTRGVVKEVYEDHVDIQCMNGDVLPISYVSVQYEDDETSSMSHQTPLAIQYMPLKLAYALTIHKCQGVTLDCAEIYLGESIFEYGQAYTALSRVKNLEGIKIIGLVKKAFRTHPDVLAFYQHSN